MSLSWGVRACRPIYSAPGLCEVPVQDLIAKLVPELIPARIGASPVPAHIRYRHAALFALACHLGGCRVDEPLRPQAEVAGVYVLTDIAGQVLPTRVGPTSPASGRWELLADTLTLAADGTIRSVQVLRHYFGYSNNPGRLLPPEDERRDRIAGTWVSRDRVVTLQYGETVEQTRLGSIGPDGALVVTEPTSLSFNPGEWRYRRL